MFGRAVPMAFVVIVLVVAAGVWCGLSSPGRACAADAKESRVQELLKERLAAARELYRSMTDKMETGTAIVGDLQAAHQTLVRAEVDLCGTDQERIAVLERSVAEARRQEEIIGRMIRDGLYPAVDALKAKVYRLETELALERLKAN